MTALDQPKRCSSLAETECRPDDQPDLMESRLQPGPATLGHHDAMTAILLRAGFDGRGATRVYNVRGNHI